jgi:hypothetical protein
MLMNMDLNEEEWERLRALATEDDDFQIREAYPLMDDVARKAGGDDPAMDIYDDLDPRQPHRRGNA